jgi:hypothetical protein
MKIIKLEHTTYPLLCKQIERAKKALKEFPAAKDDDGVSSEKAIKEMRNYLHKLRVQNRQVGYERSITVSFGRQFKNKVFHYSIVPYEKPKAPAAPVQTLVQQLQAAGLPIPTPAANPLGRLQNIAMPTPVPARPYDLFEGDDDDMEEIADVPTPQERHDPLYEMRNCLRDMKRHMKKLREEQKQIRTYSRSRVYRGEALNITYNSLRNVPVREEFGFYMHFKKRQAAKFALRRNIRLMKQSI